MSRLINSKLPEKPQLLATFMAGRFQSCVGLRFISNHSILIIINRMNIFLKFQGSTAIVSQQDVNDLTQYHDILLLSEGRVVKSNCPLQNNQTIEALLKLPGGKGGFGAKLKTEGGKKVRPNQNMFSRDMQGRPVVYNTIAKQYEQFYKNKLANDQKVQKQIADFKVVSSTYKQDYASTKLDSTYNAEMEKNDRTIEDAMKVGIKKYLSKKAQEVKERETEFDDLKVEIKADEHEQDKKEEQELGMPAKKVKLDSQKPSTMVKESKVEAPKKFSSAAEKLKSLFKK